MASRQRRGRARGAVHRSRLSGIDGHAARGRPGTRTSGGQPVGRRRRGDPARPEHLPGPVRGLSRHRCQGLPWQRPDHRRLGARRVRRADRQDHLGGRARHRDAGQPDALRRRGVDADRLPAHAQRAGRTGGRPRRRGPRRAAVLGGRRRQLRALPHGRRARRPARAGVDPHRRVAVGGGARARDSDGRARSFRSDSRPSRSLLSTARRCAACARTRTPSRCR